MLLGKYYFAGKKNGQNHPIHSFQYSLKCLLHLWELEIILKVPAFTLKEFQCRTLPYEEWNPVESLFLRWTAAEALFTYFKLQGTTAREPWAYDDDAVKSFRELAELRYSLMPYILSEAEKAVQKRIPLSRPLVMAYPDDLNVMNIEDEFMFGSSLLVAPILTEDGRRSIYLPEGEWVYFYDNKAYQGKQWVMKEEEFNRVPFFIRKGTSLDIIEGEGRNLQDYLRLPRVKRTF